MTGIAFVTNGAAWMCSNMCDYSSVMERDGKVFKKRQDLKLISIFGDITVGEPVECLFKPDSGQGQIIGLKGRVRAVVDKTAYISIFDITDNIKEIYNKIKGGKQNG